LECALGDTTACLIIATSVSDVSDFSSSSTTSSPLDWRELSTTAGLDERELRAACRRRRYARNEVIFHAGDPAGALHLIDSGHVAIRLTTVLGETAIIDVLRTGDCFGERVLVAGSGPRSATAVAMTAVETLTLDPVSFERLSAGRPETSRFLMLLLSERLNATSQQLLEARYVPAEQRLHRCLHRLAVRFDALGGEPIPLTQSDVASIAGITRSTANRLLRQAERDGVVAIGRGRVSVLDVPALQRRMGLSDRH
jgi:CRP/FNR family cyclic AMP-dependent transcriptional regulator